MSVMMQIAHWATHKQWAGRTVSCQRCQLCAPCITLGRQQDMKQRRMLVVIMCILGAASVLGAIGLLLRPSSAADQAQRYLGTGHVTRHLLSSDSIAAELVQGLKLAGGRTLLLDCSKPFWALPAFDSLAGAHVTCFDSNCEALERARQGISSSTAAGRTQRDWRYSCGGVVAGAAAAAAAAAAAGGGALSSRQWWAQATSILRQRSTVLRPPAHPIGPHAAMRQHQAGHFDVLVLLSEEGNMSLSQLHALTAFSSLPAIVVVVQQDGSGQAQRMTAFDRAGAAQHVYHLATNSFNATFQPYYDKKAWSAEGAGSGLGSNLQYTATLRRELPLLLKRHGIRSMIDSSCGGMLWMPLVLDQVKLERFLGADAACGVIEKHKQNFANRSADGWAFACLDASNQPFPNGFDLIFSRDSFQHLPLHAAIMFLHNVRNSGARYLLVGSYITGGDGVSGGRNVDVPPGGMYDINLQKPPFNLRPAPLEVIEEKTADKKHMLLYDVATLEWDEDLEAY